MRKIRDMGREEAIMVVVVEEEEKERKMRGWGRRNLWQW